MGHAVSTRAIVQRLWQRLLSIQILWLQVEALGKTRALLPELSKILG